MMGLVYSRNESDPDGPVEAKVVEEVFERFAGIIHLHVEGEVIRTTAEHPFYVRGKGWVPVKELHEGDRILALSGEWIKVEEVYDTGEWEPVYNLRVADWHTYFVGDESWGFAVWAHNQYVADTATLANTYSQGAYRTVHNSPTSSQPYSKVWFIPTGTNANAINKAAAVDNATGIGDVLQAKAQSLASGWKNQSVGDRYAGYETAIQTALDKVSDFLETASLPRLTLDGVDRGTEQMTMPNPPEGFRQVVQQFYRQRGWYMGKYVHNETKKHYENAAHSIPGLVYHETGPDFTYQATANDPITYFELLTDTKFSREKHDERHGSYLWRAVFYTFGVSGPDVSDIE